MTQQQTLSRGLTLQPIPIAIDRTRVLDETKLWPNPTDCPDWPFLTGTMRYDGARGRAAAEDRLNTVSYHLNRGVSRVKPPRTAECRDEIARVFKPSGSKWHGMGIDNLSPLGMLTEQEAELMVEAAHLRGYLRKLEAREAREAEAKVERAKSEARQTLANYRAEAPALIDEVKALTEAAARHQQRLDDEKAFDRRRMLRQQVTTLREHAVSAAHRLEMTVPDAPDFGD